MYMCGFCATVRTIFTEEKNLLFYITSLHKQKGEKKKKKKLVHIDVHTLHLASRVSRLILDSTFASCEKFHTRITSDQYNYR